MDWLMLTYQELSIMKCCCSVKYMCIHTKLHKYWHTVFITNLAVPENLPPDLPTALPTCEQRSASYGAETQDQTSDISKTTVKTEKSACINRHEHWTQWLGQSMLTVPELCIVVSVNDISPFVSSVFCAKSCANSLCSLFVRMFFLSLSNNNKYPPLLAGWVGWF